MKNLILLIGCLLANYCFAQKLTKSQTNFLKQYQEDYINAIRHHQPEPILRYYDQEVRVMPEFQQVMIGKEQLKVYYQAYFNRFDPENYQRSWEEVLDLGKLVYEQGQFSMKMVLKNADKSQEVSGKYVNLWQKQEDGSLVLITEAWNYNHGLDFEDQMKFPEVPSVNVALQAHLPIDNAIRFELAALNHLMEATVSQHAAEIWAQFYTEDGKFLYSRNPIYHGQKELSAFLKIHAAEMPIFEKLDIRNDRIDHLGAYVVEYSSHIAIIRNGNFSGVFTGKDLRIWRRNADGSLKIFRHIAMYD